MQDAIRAGRPPATTHERELIAPVDLCTPRGQLNEDAIGWSRGPLHRCNLSRHWPRRKRWNYWCLTSDRYLFSATIADLDYLGTAFVYFLDFETLRFIEQTVTVPLARGLDLPQTVAGEVAFRHPKMNLDLLDRGETAVIRVHCDRFGGEPLQAEVAVRRPLGHETLNVVIPWSRHRFQFTSKQNTLPASGVVRLGGRDHEFEAGKTFACLDYGRGVWPYRCFWNWGAASGLQAGRAVGLNLGGGWTDGTAMTENGVCIDGHLTKIGDELEFACDRGDFMRPWTITSRASSSVRLRFEPFFERVARTNLLLLGSEVHQLFGRYSGTVLTDSGETVALDRLTGWVEQHKARW